MVISESVGDWIGSVVLKLSVSWSFSSAVMLSGLLVKKNLFLSMNYLNAKIKQAAKKAG